MRKLFKLCIAVFPAGLLALFYASCYFVPSQGTFDEPVKTKLEMNNTQFVAVGADRAYHPNYVVAKADIPLVIAFDYWPPLFHWLFGGNCLNTVEFPELGLSYGLVAYEANYYKIPAQPPGELNFQCSNGMAKGKIVFQ